MKPIFPQTRENRFTFLIEASDLRRNSEKIQGYLNSKVLSQDLIPPHVNLSNISVSDYADVYAVIKTVKEGAFAQLGLDPCILEDELNKVGLGPRVTPRSSADWPRPLLRPYRARDWPSSPSRKP